MKKLWKSKQSVLIGILIFIVLLCVIFGLGGRNVSEDKKDSNDKEPVEMTDNVKNTNDEDVETNDGESKKENGLNVMETPNGMIDSVDGSGSWDAKDTTKKDTTTSGNNSDENILVDDKVWGDVN